MGPVIAVALDATSGTAAWQFASAEAEVGAGQLTVGGVVSFTVNVVVHVLLLPDPSVAVTVIVCEPDPTIVPAAGLCVNVTAPQLSEAVAPEVTSGTAA